MTLDDGRYRGTIDRVTEGTAVILIESDNQVTEEVHYPAEDLSENAREMLGVVEVTIKNGNPVEIEHQLTETKHRLDRLKRQFNRLAQRPPSDEKE